MANEAEDKAAFFNRLYELNDISDNEDKIDTGRQLSKAFRRTRGRLAAPIQVSASSSFNVPTVPPVVASPPETRTPDLHRAFTEPSIGSGRVKETPLLHRQARPHSTKTPTPLAQEVSFVQDTPLAQRHSQDLAMNRPEQRRTVSAPVPSANPTDTFPAPTPVTTNSKLGKRKRNSKGGVQLKPENEQIFRTFTFFYVPNDDKNPVRKARIIKAQEHGVAWATEWSSLVTHVIVDKSLTYKDVVSFLKIERIPEYVECLIDRWPLDCIACGGVVDARQPIYAVRGSLDVEGKGKSKLLVNSSQPSDTSLKVKMKQSKPTRWDYVPPRETPARSEEPSPRGVTLTGLMQRSSRSQSQSHRANISDVESSPKSRDTRQVFIEESSINNSWTSSPAGNMSDELDAAIRETQQSTDQLLDDELDFNTDNEDRPVSRDNLSSFISDQENSSPIRAGQNEPHKNDEVIGGQEFFSCMKGGTGHLSASNPNFNTIAKLQEMADIYTQTKDQYRAIAYRKLISLLKRQTEWISTYEQAIALPGVGKRLALKIVEIATTKGLRRLQSAKEDPNNQVLQLFLNIYGVGLSQASKWLAAGYTTLEDLKAKAELTENQRIGIDHYDDLLTRIPRDEMTALGDIVKQASMDLDPEVEVIIGGSYRRGMPTSGDIDFVITKPGTTQSSEIIPFLHSLVSTLTASGFLVCELAVPRDDSGTKWHGCCVLPSSSRSQLGSQDPIQEEAFEQAKSSNESNKPPIWRRIDFLLVPASEFGAAIIYFTGNDIFNRSMRLLASRKGMRLNQRGLYRDVMRGPQRAKITDGELVEGRDEKQIFEALGVPWKAPEERIC